MTCRSITMLTLILTVLLSGDIRLAFAGGATPSTRDKCPVCGMFVSKYPDWLGSIQYKGGVMVFFDGPKDLFRYLTNPKRYAPSRKADAIESILVRDYYRLRPIDARRAFYVVGSDVFGPMGKELIPFEKEDAAKEFLRDHQGKKLLRFPDVMRQAPAVLE